MYKSCSWCDDATAATLDTLVFAHTEAPHLIASPKPQGGTLIACSDTLCVCVGIAGFGPNQVCLDPPQTEVSALGSVFSGILVVHLSEPP
jgi:hypothetical protein